MKTFLFGCFVIAIVTMPASADTITIQPSTLTVAAGQAFSIDVMAQNNTDLYAFQFDVRFTPGAVAISSVSEGTFLASAGTTVFESGSIDNTAGTVSFIADSLIGLIPGASGNGTLATVSFQALSSGLVPINLSNVVLLDSTLLPISATLANGTVNVTGISPSSVPEPNTGSLLLLGASMTAAGLRSRESICTWL